MSSWRRHDATGVQATHNVSRCLQNDMCSCSDWDSFSLDNPLVDRSTSFVTIGSIRYGVRVGAVSPPPPGAHYRATVGLLHHQRDQFLEDCGCGVVNFPWSRSAACVSQIPLLVDEQQPSINNCDIFSPVNSVDIPNSSSSCTSIGKRSEHKIAVCRTHSSQLSLDNGCSGNGACWTNSATNKVQVQTSSQIFLQNQFRRRVIVPPHSDAPATLVKLYQRDLGGGTIAGAVATASSSAHCAPTSKQREFSTRQNNLDRLNKFRFGGNRAASKEHDNVAANLLHNRPKKVVAGSAGAGGRTDDKAERLRELTDRWKKAASQKYQCDGSSPVPPPRSRNSGNYHHQSGHKHKHSVNVQTETQNCDRRLDSVEEMPASASLADCATETQRRIPESEFVTGAESPEKLHDSMSTVVSLDSTTDSVSPAPLALRTVPFRSMSFSQLDYSLADGKYIRRRKADAGELAAGTLTMPRKKTANQKSSDKSGEKRETGNASARTREPKTKLSCTDQEVKRLFESINLTAGIFSASDEYGLDELGDSDTHPTASVVGDVSNCLALFDGIEEGIIENERDSNVVSSQDKKRDRSRRRKGIYISQWPDQRETMLECGNQSNIPLDRLSAVAANEEGIDVSATKDHADSLSEGEGDSPDKRPFTQIKDTLNCSPIISDPSDSETRSNVSSKLVSPRAPRRFSKRPLRGPYGQMLEAEMKKPDTNKIFSKSQQQNDLKFLEEYCPQRSSSPNMPATSSMISLNTTNSTNSEELKPTHIRFANHSFDDTQLKSNSSPSKSMSSSGRRRTIVNEPYFSTPNSVLSDCDGDKKLFGHHRTTSSPSKLEVATIMNQTDSTAVVTPSNELLQELLRGSSERLTMASLSEAATGISAAPILYDDTRTHIVIELYETERSYVESLHILVLKYLEPLKSPENSGLLDAAQVDEIFYQIPDLLVHHQGFLEDLRNRLEHWNPKQKIGDVLLDFAKPAVVETYTAFINNWKRAKEVIKTTSQAKPAFSRFLEAMAREHKGKLALDSLLIKPVQKFPKYELLIQRLIKHTDSTHPDYQLLLEAQKEIHENLIKINCTERETLEYEQQQQYLKDLESLVEGLVNLVTTDRIFLRHDLVTMTSGQGARKERGLFLFSDLLVITSIKRKSGTIRKTSGNFPSSLNQLSSLDANKYKLLMRISLEDLEIMKAKDDNVRRMMVEIDNLTEDISLLNQMIELTWHLHCPKNQLEEVLKEMLSSSNRQLTEQQSSDSQLSYLELTVNTANEIENLSILFSQPEKRASWEDAFNEAKHKLAMIIDKRPSPEFLISVPIRKTRAGLQFTCASPTLSCYSGSSHDVWVCNSDGYVGQVCILSLYPEPTVTSCNGVCNARILCIASIPAGISNSSSEDEDSEKDETNLNLRQCTSSERNKSTETTCTDSSDDTDCQQPTMWLGTEDGCIHVYNCNDNIRIKKNKIRLQHCSSIQSIIYLDNRVFVSLANGDLTIYSRDQVGCWNISSPITVSVGTSLMPVNKMLPNKGKLWCGCSINIKIFNIQSLTVEHTFQVNSDQNKPISCMVISGMGVWLSLQNSAIIKCFHSITYENLCEVNVAPSVTKMLTSCDDIIRQHKAACLRVTSLLACKDLLWIGTSAGVLLTMSLPHINATTSKVSLMSSVIGVPHGHTGHVRFLTCVENVSSSKKTSSDEIHYGENNKNSSKLLIISGGDGYEDFRSSNVSEVAGREDSTNHLLLWHV